MMTEVSLAVPHDDFARAVCGGAGGESRSIASVADVDAPCYCQGQGEVYIPAGTSRAQVDALLQQKM